MADERYHINAISRLTGKGADQLAYTGEGEEE